VTHRYTLHVTIARGELAYDAGLPRHDSTGGIHRAHEIPPSPPRASSASPIIKRDDTMTEQELIDTINALIDADWQAGTPALIPEDIAWRAIDRCGDGAFTTEAVTDLVLQILTARCEPWKISPGTRPACARGKTAWYLSRPSPA
jgi:hypothetical protein